jgi:hypothetical protein
MQTTGLDWNKVALTLSTATPNNGKAAPVFNAWFLDYIYPGTGARSSYDMGVPAPMEMEEVAVVAQNSISYKKEPQIKIRGAASLSQKDPLYIVDGQYINSDQL